MKLCMSCGVSEEFKIFLASQKIHTAEDSGLATVAEDKASAEIIDVANAAVAKSDLINDKGNVRRFYIACRANMRSDAKQDVQVHAVDTPLRPESALDLKSTWAPRHNIVVPET